jgi:hypothetical protein
MKCCLDYKRGVLVVLDFLVEEFVDLKVLVAEVVTDLFYDFCVVDHFFYI